MKQRKSNYLLLSLLNLLADFDGEISPQAIAVLDELKTCENPVPPLYADVFGLPGSAICADLVQRVKSLTSEQVALSSYAFQVFRSYEQMLRVDTTGMNPAQRAASEAQMAQVRLSVERAKSAIAEAIGQRNQE